MNLAMHQASKYRRYVRDLQKKWRSKYQNRTKMLIFYIEEQLKITLKAYPQLKAVEYAFREKNAALLLAQQYQKEVAAKLKESREVYYQKL